MLLPMPFPFSPSPLTTILSFSWVLWRSGHLIQLFSFHCSCLPAFLYQCASTLDHNQKFVVDVVIVVVVDVFLVSTLSLFLFLVNIAVVSATVVVIVIVIISES